MEASAPTFGNGSFEVRCRPCRKTYVPSVLANPKRCPQCGGPTVTTEDTESMETATRQSLLALRHDSARVMRITSYSMASVQIMTYFYSDRQAANFFNDTVTIASLSASVATEVWARTGARVWMVIASILMQAAAIMFFFVATAFFILFLPGQLSVFLACLPLAGSLAAWNHFRGYNNILRLNKKRG